MTRVPISLFIGYFMGIVFLIGPGAIKHFVILLFLHLLFLFSFSNSKLYDQNIESWHYVQFVGSCEM
jgi:hypothetical protein